MQNKYFSNPTTTYNFSIELLHSPIPSTSTSTSSVPIPARPATRNRVIGVIGAVRGPEIGYMLHPDFWGQGYATEALDVFMTLFWAYVPSVTNSGFFASPSTKMPAARTTPAADITARGTLASVPLPPHADQKPNVRPLYTGHDYAEAVTDTENLGSRAVLRKCGFELWRTTERGFVSPIMGVRDTAFYRIARPGTRLVREEG